VDKEATLGFTEISNILLGTLLLRLASVVVVILTLPARQALPQFMAQWLHLISYPLLFYNLMLLIFHKKTAIFLQKHPLVLFIDLFIAVGILQIGGGWRSSYFGYTLTSIMLFTIFGERRGSYTSSVILAVAAMIKDPSGELPSLEVFDVSTLDMRLGAVLFYIMAGLILGYFSTLLKTLELLSKAKVEETRKLSAMGEKTRLALELHDGAKQMVSAMLLKLNPLIKKTKSVQEDIADELRWHWRGMNYLQSELNQVMDALRGKDHVGRSTCNIVTIADEEARIAEVMTGFSWKALSESSEILLPSTSELPLRRFCSEALMNAWKHSGVTTGTIEARCSGGSVIIAITDNGRGFNDSDIENKGTAGLKSLKHRAEALKGDLAIETAPGKGCKLILNIPAHKKQN
jgi:signal transduction histidine kinase